MRIKSDFKDYYDGLAAYDEDRETLFLRPSKEEFLSKELDIFPINPNILNCKSNTNFIHRRHIIGFAGKLYPLIRCEEKNQIFYDLDVYLEHYKDTESWWKYNLKNIWNWPQKNIKKFEPLFDKYGPVMIIRRMDYGQGIKITRGPLDGWGFAKILNPALAYNSLRNWIHNQASPEKPIPEISNEDKIVLAGFNTKTSFRKDKS